MLTLPPQASWWSAARRRLSCSQPPSRCPATCGPPSRRPSWPSRRRANASCSSRAGEHRRRGREHERGADQGTLSAGTFWMHGAYRGTPFQHCLPSCPRSLRRPSSCRSAVWGRYSLSAAFPVPACCARAIDVKNILLACCLYPAHGILRMPRLVRRVAPRWSGLSSRHGQPREPDRPAARAAAPDRRAAAASRAPASFSRASIFPSCITSTSPPLLSRPGRHAQRARARRAAARPPAPRPRRAARGSRQHCAPRLAPHACRGRARARVRQGQLPGAWHEE